MPSRIILFLSLLTVGFSQAKAQSNSTPINIGSKIIIQSEVLGQDRNIRVFLPDSYTTEKVYPVLYLLDGQNWSNYSVGLREMLVRFGYTPEFIIVGIDTEDAPRYGFFANADRLIEFLDKDVLSYINSNYKTSGENLLFGWQFAGAFTIEVLAKRPELFDSYLAASPIPLNQSRLDDLTSYLEKDSDDEKNLFFTTSVNEDAVQEGVDELITVLGEKASENVNWEHSLLDLETIASFGHRTTPLETIYKGLRRHYSDYTLLEFNTIQDFEAAGGYEYVDRYYLERSTKYGLPNGIPEEAMFFLVRMGWDNKHFESFDYFIKKFSDTAFLSNLNMGWNRNFASFYMESESPQGAITIYEGLKDRFPENPTPLNDLGHAYALLGNSDLAKENFQLSVSLAEKNNNRNLAKYKKDLEEFLSKN